MKHRQIRRELEKSIRSSVRKNALPIVLRDYQRETLISTADWLRNMKGSRAAYIQHPTGSGKTVLFATTVSKAKNLRCLIVVPSKLLVSQTVQEIVKFTKHSIGHVSSLGKIHDDKNGELIAMRGTEGQRIVVTTDASLKSRAQRIAKEFDPHVVIRDECHWSYTERSQQATKLFPEAVIIGYSATPDYLTTIAKPDYIPVTLDNGQVLYVPPNRMARTYYPTLLDQRTLRWGIEHEYLAPLAWGFLEFDASLDGIPVNEGPNGPDYDAEALAKMMADHWPLLEEVICRLYQDNAYNIRKRQVCAICPSVAQAESLAKKIAKYVPSACVSGSMPNEERDEILTSFDVDRPTTKDYRFVASVFVLREGWNARNAEIALMLRPTKSRTLYEQFMGRIMRLRRDGKKKIALVLDLLFTGTKLAPLNAPALYGVPGEKIREGGILIAPKRKGKKVRITSPYLPKNIRPRIRVVQALEVDYILRDGGFFEENGVYWVSTGWISGRLAIPEKRVKLHVANCRARHVRASNGNRITLYAFQDFERLNRALITLFKKCKVDADGLLRRGGEIWATRKMIARIIHLNGTTINRYIRKHKVKSMKGVDVVGQPAVLYSLTEIQSICRSLVAPDIDSNGFRKVDKLLWGSTEAIAKKNGISQDAVERTIKSKKLSFCKGRPNGKFPVRLYLVKEVEELCRHLIGRSVEVDGFLTKEGRLWGMRKSLQKRYKLRPTATVRYTKFCRSFKSRTKRGNATTFYLVDDFVKILERRGKK